MSNAFIYRMPAGIPGDVSRKEMAKIEPQLFDADYPCLFFGIPVKMSSGKIRPMATEDTGQPYGFLVRPYPSMMSSSEAVGTATPDVTKVADILVSGYMTVKNYDGTPAAGGAVYYRSQAGSPAGNQGHVTAENDGSPTTSIAITGCHFMGAEDSNGNVEISFNV
jgi:hypothetical protein